MRTRAQDGDPTAVDVAYLAATYSLSEADLQTLLTAPTADLVQALFAALATKGYEFDELKADKLKVDVELETAVRTSETKVKAQKSAVARHVKEIEEVRKRLNESEAAGEALQNELALLKTTSSGTSAETQALRQRIETLEASNRDALALVESKSTEKDRFASELSEQHTKLVVLRREVGQLEERNQALENVTSSQKFKEQSLQQEIDLLKRNNEWHATELQTRTQEHVKFRKERNSRISALERDLEEANSAVETLKRTETTLRKRLDDVQAKADEAFARIASLQEESARKEQSFRTELNGSKRLSELQAQNAATHKARSMELQAELEQVKEDTREELGRLQAEIETERLDKEDAERKVADLELKVEALEQRVGRPATPRQNGGLDPQTPGRGGSRSGSPSALPGSMRKIVGGLSFTQLYTQYTEAQEELENERRRTNKLTTALDELITELETKKPEIEELRSEQERMEEEVLNYSKLLDDANDGRETAIAQSEHWQGEAEAATREGQILRQQLRDLSAQIKILLVEIQSRDQGLGELSAEERLELERAARGELDHGSLDEMTSTGRLISERLVIFRDVAEMQDKNAQLLRITRTLGEQMEGEEAREKARKSAADAQEVGELRQQVERYKDELRATATQIDSYMKERDMFRRMLQHRGQLQPDADLQSIFGQSIPPATPGRGSVPPPATPRSKDVEDLNKLLKEQQTFFDQYRNESSTDRRMLKEQVDALAREKSTLQADLARMQSQLTLASERFDMLQSNYNALRSENSELQKRSQQLAEQAAKQDLRTQQVAEELIEARSMTDSLRNENANAKAEKELWKRIEGRLTEDNKSLMDERSRLNKLVADLQNLQNERELSESEGRRRLQGRLETLESELSATKKKLETEVEESRKSVLRKEYEENQSRSRIDDLVKSLGNVREELVAAKTTRDQLQARVEEMRIELRSAEEKVTALQPRPTPRPSTGQNSNQQSNGDEDDLPAEQRLALEMSELRRDLELSRAELENAKQQVEQYRSIAQASEEELANLSETADTFKEDNDRVLDEKDARIKELQQRIEDLISEMTTTNNELSELRAKADDSDRALVEQKTSLEAEMTRLRDDVERDSEEKKLFQEDIKAQAEIAQQAQQSYEDELVKHAEAARSLQNVRKEYNDLRTEVAGFKAEAEASKISLEHAEESWSEQRERFEREIEDLKRKRQDVDEQNKILHQNLETFSNELAALRQGRVAESHPEGSAPGSASDGNFQEVIKFLRREKEIVDVQYELSQQETKRLQQQLEYANNQLEEVRQKLAEEQRQSADKATTEITTNRLMQTMNELNLYRESATTLRNESRQARERLEEKSGEVERLLAELEPIKGRVVELEGDLESKEGEVKLLQDDRDHWRERTQNIISKYDRVDPAELEDIKKQLDELKEEKQRLESEQVPLKEQIEGFDARLESEKSAATQALSERLEKFKGQAKEQDRKRVEKIRDITTEKDGIARDLEQARSELTTTNTELERMKTDLEEARAMAKKVPGDDAEEGEIEQDGTATGNDDHAELHRRIAEAERNASEHASRSETLAAEVKTLQARIQELEGQAKELQQQLEASQIATGEQNLASSGDVETLEKLKQDLATAQNEVESLRAIASASASQAVINADPAPGEKSVAEQVAEEVAREKAKMEQQHEVAKKQMDEETNRRIENMKASLKQQLNNARAKIKDELVKEHQAEVQRLKDEHNAAIENLQEVHKAELARLSKAGDTAAANAEQAQAVKAEPAESASGEVDVTKLTLSDAQARELVKSNAGIKTILTNSVRTQVDKQTEKLKAIITSKDEEIKKLNGELQKAPVSGEAHEVTADTSGMVSREELERQLDAAKKEKEAAVQKAHDLAAMKGKLQINQLSMIQAKMNVVKKAAADTPTKPIKEVWDIAEKARPATTATAKPGTAPSAAGSPAAKPQPAPPAAAAAAPTTQLSASNSAAELSEEAKKAERLKRFGNAAADASGTPGTGTFGQPSRPASSLGTNPQASTFTPNASASGAQVNTAQTGGAKTGIPQPGGAAGGSKLPHARPPSRAGSISGTGVQVAGAAAQPATATRGGFGFRGTGRGGRGGVVRGGGPAANAGQKRQHDGAGEGGDTKRTRGGGPTGGAA